MINEGGKAIGSDGFRAEPPGRIWISGVGICCSLGNAPAQVAAAIWNGRGKVVGRDLAGRKVFHHDVEDPDIDRHIRERKDRRLLSRLMELGVYAAGEALAAANIGGEQARDIHIRIATDNGERPVDTDSKIISAIRELGTDPGLINGLMMRLSRSTRVLSELPNMLSANIGVAFGIDGSSRTFIGGAVAGAHAIRSAIQKLDRDHDGVCLVGGAFNAAKVDMLLSHIVGTERRRRSHAHQALDDPGVLGTAAAFLVLEQEDGARRRGAPFFGYITDFGLVPPESGAHGEATEVSRGPRTRLVCRELQESPEWTGGSVETGAVVESNVEARRSGVAVECTIDLEERLGDCGEASVPLALAIGACMFAPETRTMDAVGEEDDDGGRPQSRLVSISSVSDLGEAGTSYFSISGAGAR